MAIFLLDTDMVSLHQRNQSRVIAAVDSHPTDQLCVSTVTLEVATPTTADADTELRRPITRRTHSLSGYFRNVAWSLSSRIIRPTLPATPPPVGFTDPPAILVDFAHEFAVAEHADA